MSKLSKITKRAKIFNIDREAKKYYPSVKVLIPATAGLQHYHMEKVNSKTMVTNYCFREVVFKRA